MPFLRFSRDKRGYESTYLCHTFRRGGKQELRVLYWFRTPPDVKVGRLALDSVAIHAIEESNPDLKFDWGKILEVKPPPPPPDYGRDGHERRRRGRGKGAGSASAAPPSTSAPAQVAASTPVVAVEVAADPTLHESEGEAHVPAIAAWDDPDLGDDPTGPTERAPSHVVLGLTDEQGLARLRARHAEIQARISERVRDPVQLVPRPSRRRPRRAPPRRARRGGARRGRRREGRGTEPGGVVEGEPSGSPAGTSPGEPSVPSRSEDDPARDE
jgi:hypothetical protein